MRIHQITPLPRSEKSPRQTKGEILVSLKQIEVEFNQRNYDHCWTKWRGKIDLIKSFT